MLTFAQRFLGLLAQAVPGEGGLAAALVGPEHDVVTYAVGRVQTDHRMRLQPTAFDQALEHALAIAEHTLGFRTHHLVFQDGGEGAGQIPGLEERAPVDEGFQFSQIEVFEDPLANEFRRGRLVSGPIQARRVRSCLDQWQQRRLFFVGVQLAHLGVVGVEFVDVLRGLVTQQALRHAHAARGVGHINHRAFVMRRDFHSGVHPAAGGTPDQQRDFAQAEVIVLLHFTGHVLHLFQARGDQARQADDVRAFHLGTRQDLVAGHHHAHVHHVKVVALQDHGDDVFANVMHIAFDRGNHDLALGFHVFACGFLQTLFFFDVRNQVRHGLLHDAC